MQKNKLILAVVVLISSFAVTACGIEKLNDKKIADTDFTVVSNAEMPKEVLRIVEERKENPFKVTYSDEQYTYIIVGYGKQQYHGYSIRVNEVYETKNAICVRTEFEGPKEYRNNQEVSYPYIVIKIKVTDKNVVFHE